MNLKTVADSQDESSTMKQDISSPKRIDTKKIVPYFHLGEYYKEKLINKLDLSSLSSQEKIVWDDYYIKGTLKNNSHYRASVDYNKVKDKYHVRKSMTKTSNSKKYKIIDSSLFHDLIYGLYTDENHIKYLEEVSGLKLKTNKEERNKYSLNYYGPREYIPVHVDTHDLVLLIVLKTDSENNCTYYIDERYEDISDLFKEQYPNFEKIKAKSKIIKTKEGEAVLFRGGMFPHFTLPHDGERIVIVLNYNIDKNGS